MIRITINTMLSASIAAVLYASFLAPAAQADVLELKNGGRIDGILLNPDENNPRTQYIMRLETGGRMTIAPDQVKRYVGLTEAQRLYQRNLKKMPATAEANYKVAEWCKKVGLRNERRLHLEATIELDPEHASARYALGYIRPPNGGDWAIPAEIKRSQGLVQHEGKWRLPQDVEIAKQRRANKLAQIKWAKDIKLWRGWLGKPKDQQKGYALLKAIKDPMAAPALAEALEKEQVPSAQFLYVNALAKMSGPVATKALVNMVLRPGRSKLDANDLDLRDKALSGLELNDRDLAVDAFIHALGSKENATINRAAFGLKRMPETRAIRPLIDALQTKHSYKKQSNPGQISTSFGSGGTGLSTGGGGAKTVTDVLSNRDVLEALLEQSDGVDFQYNQVAWRNWYATKDIPQVVDLRRRP